jgi:hypothetical protein
LTNKNTDKLKKHTRLTNKTQINKKQKNVATKNTDKQKADTPDQQKHRYTKEQAH